MAIQYKVVLEKKDKDISVTRTFNGESDSDVITEKISLIQEMCKHFNWNEPSTSQKIGKILFDIVNGNNRLKNAVKEADAYGEPLQLYIQRINPVPDLPFELLYDSQFLVPLKVHVIRHVSDYGYKKEVHPAPRPLRVLFMACSPQDIQPVLDFEKEEESILGVTKDLPVDMDVEETGSLQGLHKCLETNEYDVIHVTGHANIKDGVPYFCMENEEGFLEEVTPSQLQEILNSSLERPRLVFLSGCRTGETPTAAASFAHELVLNHSPTVVGWGLPVTDPGAMKAAAQLYHELGRGKSIADAVFSTREILYKNDLSDWCLLRLFSDGTPLDIPLVEKGQQKTLKARDIQYAYLENSKVKVLKRGFVGRRRHIQKGIKTLKSDEGKVGLLLHGTGGLGKSCLAGKFCDRFKDHDLIVVNGELNAVTFLEALKTGLANDEKGLHILEADKEIPDKIMQLCLSCFQEKNYLIVLDDFEKNLKGYERGDPVVAAEALPVLGALLLYLPYAVKMSQVIITSRYTFPLTIQGQDLITEKLELIGLTSFRGADERKKVLDLKHLREYSDENIRKELIEAGRGNPRLMEALNELLKVEKGLDVKKLLKKVKGKQEEFVQGLILQEILKSQLETSQKVLQYSAVFGLPVLIKGIQLVCKNVKDWQSSIDLWVQLSLLEKDSRGDVPYYWVTPLLQKDIFEDLSQKEKIFCHRAAVIYYRKFLSLVGEYLPVYAFEVINHALQCGMDEVALEEGSTLLAYLRKTLAYKEAKSEGEYILSQIPDMKEDEKSSLFFYQLGWIYDDIGEAKKAVTYYEKALKIDKKIHGEIHPHVARDYNNLGGAWHTLGDPKKAIGYYEKALKINKKIYGEAHPDVATDYNNLGLAWHTLGDPKKAIGYYEKALSIFKDTYGETHPHVAATFNNLGGAWADLGNPKKAIEYYEKALKIDKKIYGETHPAVATRLNNLGAAWKTLGNPKKAIEYLQQAYTIFQKVYGDDHPHTRTVKKSLDSLRDTS